VRWLLEEHAAAWTAAAPGAADADAWREEARLLLLAAHAEILDQAHTSKLAPAPTTFSVALARPAEDLLVHASIGDGHVFVVTDDDAPPNDLGWAPTGRRGPYFLGEAFDGGAPDEDQLITGCTSLAGVTAVVLASDGLSEDLIGVSDPAATVAECVGRARAARPALRPLEACRNVTEAALEAHRKNRSGDNIAAAVLWISAEDRAGS